MLGLTSVFFVDEIEYNKFSSTFESHLKEMTNSAHYVDEYF